MKPTPLAVFSILYLGLCVTFADALFPWSAIALAVWIIPAAYFTWKPTKSSAVK